MIISKINSSLSQADDLEEAYSFLQQGRHSEAEPILQKLRSKGDGFASLYLAYINLSGISRQKDLGAARMLLQEAAEKGIRAAQYNLGYTLMKDENYDGAKHWLNLAAESGDAAAMYQLYRLYRLAPNGYVEKNVALSQLKKSAGADFPFAMRELQKLELLGNFGICKQILAVVLLPYRAVRTIKLLVALNRNERFKPFS